MRNLFATLLVISAGTFSIGTLPAIANSANDLSAIRQASTQTLQLSASPDGSTLKYEDPKAPNAFVQGSLKLAKQIPSDAIGVLVFNVNPMAWQTSVTSSEASSPLLAVQTLLSYLSESAQYAIAKDIPLWSGSEVALTFLLNPTPQEMYTVAVVASISNDKQYELFVKKIPTILSVKPTEMTYQGVQILEWQLENADPKSKPEALNQPKKKQVKDSVQQIPSSETAELNRPDFIFKRLAIAKLPNGYAVIASDRQAIQKMIDISISNASQQALPSLAEQPLFLRSLNNPLWNRSLLAGYGDFKGIGKLSELFAADLPETSEIPGFNRTEYIQGLQYTLSQYNSFELFAWLTPQGIRSQSNTYFSEVRSPSPKDREPRDQILSYLPSNIYSSISSRNFKRQWQWFVEQSNIEPTYKFLVEGLRMLKPLMLQAGLDLDLEKDVISWMDGEYAFVAFPSDRSPLQYLGLDLTFGALVRTSKPAAANAALAKFTKYLSKLNKNVVQVKKRQVKNVSLTSIEIPDLQTPGKTESIFAYGWRDPQTLMLTLGAPTASAFVPTAKPSLADSQMFREAIADMPQPNFGYFYLNANALARMGAKLFLSDFFPNLGSADSPKVNPALAESIKKDIDKQIDKTVGGAVFVYSETSDRFQSDFFLGLK